MSAPVTGTPGLAQARLRRSHPPACHPSRLRAARDHQFQLLDRMVQELCSQHSRTHAGSVNSRRLPDTEQQ